MRGIEAVSTAKASNLLVVEDDPAIRELVHESLSAEGYRVATASDFGQAVEALAHTRFDLVLADALGASTTNPKADRWTILDQIRELAGYSPVVIFTAHHENDFVGFKERGFSDLLLKPFDLDELIMTVHRNLLPSESPVSERAARHAQSQQ
jgi:DNA-binding response OmpR family regulator